jgi:hypothetical protein
LGTTPREDYDDTNFDKEDSGQEDLENENMNEAPEIKTITKKEWSKIKKFNKHIGQDGTYYVMAYNDKIGTHLNPVKIVKESVNDELSGNDLEMVAGIIDILKQVKDKENRKEIALNMIKQFKEEDIDFDYSKFLSQLKEYGSNLTDTFLLPRHSDKLPGTPDEKNAIDNPDNKSGNLYEVGLGDWHFKAIQKLYQKAGSFGRKKIAAVITKNPNSNWNKIERELQDSDYYEISDYSDKLGLSEVVENLIKKKTK